MHIHSYRLVNYRRFQNTHIELTRDISIFVGSNNSGKTSATQAMMMFLSGDKSRFSMFDFSSHTWEIFNQLGSSSPQEQVSALPKISMDLWFEVTQDDLYLVLPILPSTKWIGNLVGIRVEFAAVNSAELIKRYRTKKDESREYAAALGSNIGNYSPWPKNLTQYLEKELSAEFEFKYYVLDRAQFNDSLMANDGYIPAQLSGDMKGGAVLKSLVRVDCLNAQRHLADSHATSSRSEDLSRRLSQFYKRNLAQREDDPKILKALFDSEAELNEHLRSVFAPTLERIATLGYPGLHNPKLEIQSALNPASIMNQDARIHYVVGEGSAAVRLPDSYNGLGFKNLIYMVVEILDLHARWQTDSDNRPPLHLIFIEEPEAHLHAQLQQVFVRNILSLLTKDDTASSSFVSQLVVTTHSPHIVYERGFDPIRYFRRHQNDGVQRTEVLNLSRFQAGDKPKDRDFLQRYLKLTHCDLFFADAAILVEGNVERLLMPLMIEKEAKTLRSAALCILEVGGAFGHRFKELIEFLGITTLIVTDIDSVTESPTPDDVSADEEEDIELEVISIVGENESKVRYGKACLPSVENAVTSNQTLIQWLPQVRKVSELLGASSDSKIQELSHAVPAKVCVSYQVNAKVEWNDKEAACCGRTFEESFGLENAAWCQSALQKDVGLKLKKVPTTIDELALGLHKRVTSKGFNKTKFALQVLSADKSA